MTRVDEDGKNQLEAIAVACEGESDVERASRLRRVLMAVLLVSYLTLPLWLGWYDTSQWRSSSALWHAQGTLFYVPVTMGILSLSGIVALIGSKEHGQKTFCMLNALAIMGLMVGLSLMN